MEVDMNNLKAANLKDNKEFLFRLHDEEISLHDVSRKVCDSVRDLFCNEVITHGRSLRSGTTSDTCLHAIQEILLEKQR